jgi:hypothetical protein
MKRWLGLFLWCLILGFPLGALNNRFYVSGGTGGFFRLQGGGDPFPGTYLGVNVGWQGVFPNAWNDVMGSGFGSFNWGLITEAGYYRYLYSSAPGDKPGVEFDSFRFAAGFSVGHYFSGFFKPILFMHNYDVLGVSAAVGVKTTTFVQDLIMGFGLSMEFPIAFISGRGQASFYPDLYTVQLTVDIGLELNRDKKRARLAEEADNQARIRMTEIYLAALEEGTVEALTLYIEAYKKDPWFIQESYEELARLLFGDATLVFIPGPEVPDISNPHRFDPALTYVCEELTVREWIGTGFTAYVAGISEETPIFIERVPDLNRIGQKVISPYLRYLGTRTVTRAWGLPEERAVFELLYHRE